MYAGAGVWQRCWPVCNVGLSDQATSSLLVVQISMLSRDGSVVHGGTGTHAGEFSVAVNTLLSHPDLALDQNGVTMPF
jgi:hypothetical protein